MASQRITTSAGAEVVLEESAVRAFEAGLQGRLLRPADPGYDASRALWNGMIDKRPALIARCAGTPDVVSAVRFARDNDLLVSVRGGGHNYAGKAVCDGGLMIDLSPMKRIVVDREGHTAHAQAGLRLGEFDAATHACGLATTLGVNTDTGIAGLTLGGGYGWLAGQFGLACDNLLTVEIVTADGEVRTASAEEQPDLFWGIRGAGANLGVVTEFVYRLHPLGPVVGGLVLYSLKEAPAVLRAYDELSSAAPDELVTIALLLSTPDGTPAVGIAACYSGPPEQAARTLRPLRTITTPLADLIQPKPYVEMQTLFDEAWPPGRHYYNKSGIYRSLSEEAIETLIEFARTLPTPVSAIAMQQMHGAASRVAPDATAFPHRYDHHSYYVHPATDDPADGDKIRQWAHACWNALQPYSEDAVYVNGLEDADEEGEARVRAAFGTNYNRLVRLKTEFDPTNLFRLNQNVAPARSH